MIHPQIDRRAVFSPHDRSVPRSAHVSCQIQKAATAVTGPCQVLVELVGVVTLVVVLVTVVVGAVTVVVGAVTVRVRTVFELLVADLVVVTDWLEVDFDPFVLRVSA